MRTDDRDYFVNIIQRFIPYVWLKCANGSDMNCGYELAFVVTSDLENILHSFYFFLLDWSFNYVSAYVISSCGALHVKINK